MIELIATIIVIGIAFMTVPVILDLNSKSLSAIHESKGTYHALARMQLVLDKYWDEQSYQESEVERNTRYYRVLRTGLDETQADNNLSCSQHEGNARIGHYPSGEDTLYLRRCAESTYTASTALGQENGANDFNDIDDFDGDSETGIDGRFTLSTTVQYYDYESAYVNANPNAQTIDFNQTKAAPASSTSVKLIQIGISDSFMQGTNPAQLIANYYYYATNIGRAQPRVEFR